MQAELRRLRHDAGDPRHSLLQRRPLRPGLCWRAALQGQVAGSQGWLQHGQGRISQRSGDSARREARYERVSVLRCWPPRASSSVDDSSCGWRQVATMLYLLHNVLAPPLCIMVKRCANTSGTVHTNYKITSSHVVLLSAWLSNLLTISVAAQLTCLLVRMITDADVR